MWEFCRDKEIFEITYEPGVSFNILVKDSTSSKPNTFINIFDDYVDPVMLLQAGCIQLMKALKENKYARERFLNVFGEKEAK
jgi:hypothetical protein